MGGPYGPYRQSERKELYQKYVDKLVDDGLVYPCFCTDEELAEMKADAEKKSLPPIYRYPHPPSYSACSASWTHICLIRHLFNIVFWHLMHMKRDRCACSSDHCFAQD